MTKPAPAAPPPPPLRFERNLALIFAVLGILMTTVITLHWFLVLEPTLRWDARSHSRVLAQAQAGSIEQLLGSSNQEMLKWELETRLDRLLLLKDPTTGRPFLRRISLVMDSEYFDKLPYSLNIARGEEHCAECFLSEIPLYHPVNEQLIGIATFHASLQFLEIMVSDFRIKLLWIGGSILCAIGFAWFGAERLLRRLGASEAQLQGLLDDMQIALVKYRTLFDNFPFGITVTNSAGHIVETNAASEHLLGLSPEDQLTRRIDDPEWITLRPDGSSMPANEYPALQAMDRQAVVRDSEMGIAQPNSEVRWLNVTAAPLQIENLGAVVVYEDITLRKQAQAAREAEAALRESERRFRIMADELPLIIWVQDATNSTAFVNKTCCDYFGMPEKSLTGQRWLPLIHPDDQSRFLASFTTSCIAREPFHDQCRMRRADGNWRWLESFARPVYDPDGTLTGIVGTSLDITERKAADEALHESHRELERHSEQLGRLTSELTLAEQRERERLANVLHDHLQQLLVAAAFGIERLDRRLCGQMPDKVTKDAMKSVSDLLVQAIDAARTLVADLSPPILHDGGLPDALEWLARSMLKRYDLTITLSLDRAASPQRDDVRSIVFEAVRESLFNVVKHAGCSHATLELKRQADDQLCIVIQDRGSGFDSARLNLGDSLKAGFGLLSMRERLRFLGGRCVIESAPGKGTQVTLTAPLDAAIPIETTAPEAGSNTRAQPLDPEPIAAHETDTPLRVLLVDDHAMMRQGLTMMLEDEPDLEIVGEASDGYDAIDQVERLSPDLVLMDYSMPRMDGLGATRLIKAQWPATRIIGLSMYDEADRADAMLQAGASAYVAKTGGADALLNAIRRNGA